MPENDVLEMAVICFGLVRWSDRVSAVLHRKTSNKRCNFVANETVDHSDVVGASPVGTAPATTFSFST